MSASTHPYVLQKYAGKSSRYTCPSCGKAHEFTRFIDTQSGEFLPESFGICNRADKCGYRLTPYDKGANGLSYSKEHWQASRMSSKKRRSSVSSRHLITLPEELLIRSLGHYEQNNFACLLRERWSEAEADKVIRAFEVGTSRHWPGATVFWQRDELGRVRGGQVVLFDQNGHTAKLPDLSGGLKRCTTWVHTALTHHFKRIGQSLPEWLIAYTAADVKKTPSLYGIQQLATAPLDQPVAIVEAPKTAIICSHYFPESVWMAVGSLGQLTTERLLPLRGRNITLFPDASTNGSAFKLWLAGAESLQHVGLRVTVSDFLENRATEAQKTAGIDLADLLLA